MLSADEIRRYTKLDEGLKLINKHFITLNDKDREHYSVILREVMEIIRKKMAENDTMFVNCEGATQYAGSSFDRTKVGKPDEFDMNIEIKLPAAWRNADDIVVSNASPGYVTINVQKGLDRMNNDEQLRNKYYKGISKWVDQHGYMVQDKFHSWMESVVTKAMNTFPLQGGFRILNGNYKVRYDKSGPAMTLHIHKLSDPNFQIDVDLVPVIQFNTSPNSPDIWPSTPIRSRPHQFDSIRDLRTWCAIPKPKKNSTVQGNNIEWRISFAKQERQLIHDRGCLKSLIRQLKKLKSSHPETKNLPSYYVKTMFLWELHEHPDIWIKYSNAALFMFMLKKLHKYLETNNLPFYWDERYNLLVTCGPAVKNMKDKIARIIREIDSKVDTDPYILSRFLLTQQELNEFGRINVANNLSQMRI